MTLKESIFFAVQDTEGHVFPPLQSKKEFGFRPDH